MRVVVLGEAGHAGTVPMGMRHDALTGAAEIILNIEKVAREHAADRMVATVGRIEAFPGATNVIPGRVGFSLEVRSTTDELRRGAIAQVRKDAQFVATGRKIEVTFEPFHETDTAACAPELQDLFEQAIADLGFRTTRLPSGAGHDAQVMARLCPAAMLFVRCRGGISHNPAEYASPADMGLAVAALIRFIERFAASQT
jgi:allantoate deiminase